MTCCQAYRITAPPPCPLNSLIERSSALIVKNEIQSNGSQFEHASSFHENTFLSSIASCEHSLMPCARRILPKRPQLASSTMKKAEVLGLLTTILMDGYYQNSTVVFLRRENLGESSCLICNYSKMRPFAPRNCDCPQRSQNRPGLLQSTSRHRAQVQIGHLQNPW